jgi:hypothetical protein
MAAQAGDVHQPPLCRPPWDCGVVGLCVVRDEHIPFSSGIDHTATGLDLGVSVGSIVSVATARHKLRFGMVMTGRGLNQPETR